MAKDGATPALLPVADRIAATLASYGVRFAFGIPGNDVLEVIRACEAQGIRYVLVKSEPGAAFMADAVYQLSGNAAVEPAPPAAPAAGIGVWLSLVCLGLLLKPFFIFGDLSESCRFFLSSDWHALTVPDMENYYGLWAPTIIFEQLADILLLVFSVLLLVLFFEKKRRFPLLLIIFSLLNLAVFGLDYLAMALIPAAKAHATSSTLWGFAGAAVYVMIWVPYFSFSKRVKTTFLR